MDDDEQYRSERRVVRRLSGPASDVIGTTVTVLGLLVIVGALVGGADVWGNDKGSEAAALYLMVIGSALGLLVMVAGRALQCLRGVAAAQILRVHRG